MPRKMESKSPPLTSPRRKDSDISSPLPGQGEETHQSHPPAIRHAGDPYEKTVRDALVLLRSRIQKSPQRAAPPSISNDDNFNSMYCTDRRNVYSFYEPSNNGKSTMADSSLSIPQDMPPSPPLSPPNFSQKTPYINSSHSSQRILTSTTSDDVEEESLSPFNSPHTSPEIAKSEQRKQSLQSFHDKLNSLQDNPSSTNARRALLDELTVLQETLATPRPKAATRLNNDLEKQNFDSSSHSREEEMEMGVERILMAILSKNQDEVEEALLSLFQNKLENNISTALMPDTTVTGLRGAIELFSPRVDGSDRYLVEEEEDGNGTPVSSKSPHKSSPPPAYTLSTEDGIEATIHGNNKSNNTPASSPLPSPSPSISTAFPKESSSSATPSKKELETCKLLEIADHDRYDDDDFGCDHLEDSPAYFSQDDVEYPEEESPELRGNILGPAAAAAATAARHFTFLPKTIMKVLSGGASVNDSSESSSSEEDEGSDKISTDSEDDEEDDDDSSRVSGENSKENLLRELYAHQFKPEPAAWIASEEMGYDILQFTRRELEFLEEEYDKWFSYSGERLEEDGNDLLEEQRREVMQDVTGAFGSDSDLGKHKKRGELEQFFLPIIYPALQTGFEPTKDLILRRGDVLAGRYRCISELGSAAFSTAYKCRDLKRKDDDSHQIVCLKIIKNTKDFFDQSLDEIKILNLLQKTEQANNHNILIMLSYFYTREHLVIVTEVLKHNLYDFGKKLGEEQCSNFFQNLKRLKYITKQILVALKFLHSLGLIHSDVKPENILLANIELSVIKLIDFGSSCFLQDRQSSYIQSRSYRAPEVILGLPYTGKIDMWSLGCVVAELYTNQVLFLNHSVVSMLARIEAICGVMPREMIKGGKCSGKFYSRTGLLYRKASGEEEEEDDEQDREDDGVFASEVDGVGSDVYYEVYRPKRTSMSERLGFDVDLIEKERKTDEEHEQALFANFIQKLLTIDPRKRPTAGEALQHPWILSADDDDPRDIEFLSPLIEDEVDH